MIIDFLFPNRCIRCQRIIDGLQIICTLCQGKINYTYHEYGKENELLQKCRRLFPVRNAFGLMHYHDGQLSQKIIQSLKYGNREIVGKVIAQWTIGRLNLSSDPPNLITCIPLHPKKLKKRGYNQLHLFTKSIAEHYQIPYDLELLKRNFHTKEQAKKDKKARGKIQQLFSLNKTLANKHVLIIDDVFTTGNTMANAAWEILNAPNTTISILT